MNGNTNFSSSLFLITKYSFGFYRPILLYFSESTNWLGLSTLLFTGVEWNCFLLKGSVFFTWCPFKFNYILYILQALAQMLYPSLTKLLHLEYNWDTKRLLASEISSSHCFHVSLYAQKCACYWRVKTKPYCHNRFSGQTSSIEVKLPYCIVVICRTPR